MMLATVVQQLVLPLILGAEATAHDGKVPPARGITRPRAGAVAAGPDNSDLDELTRTPRTCQRSTR